MALSVLFRAQCLWFCTPGGGQRLFRFCHMAGQTGEEHEHNLRSALDCIKTAGSGLNLEKCRWKQKELSFLGQTISKQGLKPNLNTWWQFQRGILWGDTDTTLCGGGGVVFPLVWKKCSRLGACREGFNCHNCPPEAVWGIRIWGGEYCRDKFWEGKELLAKDLIWPCLMTNILLIVDQEMHLHNYVMGEPRKLLHLHLKHPLMP